MNTSFYKNSFTVHLALHLLMEANHEEKKIIFNNEEIIIKRGQCITGRKGLSQETGIAEGTVYDKLKILEKVNFCNIKSNNRFSIVTILKYEDYQNKKTIKQQQNQQPANNQPTTSQQPANTNNNNNNVNNDNKEKICAYSFEALWGKYPNKIGRKQAKRLFEASVKTEEDYEAINRAIENYLKSERVAKGFIQNGATWFNNWRDWIENPEQGLLEEKRESEAL